MPTAAIKQVLLSGMKAKPIWIFNAQDRAYVFFTKDRIYLFAARVRVYVISGKDRVYLFAARVRDYVFKARR